MLVVVGLAFMGKIYTDDTVSIHRALEGTSANVRKITKVLGLPRYLAYFPILTISIDNPASDLIAKEVAMMPSNSWTRS